MVARLFGLALLTALTACGTHVPQINEAWEPTDVDDRLVYRIVKSVRCELVTAALEMHRATFIKNQKVARYLPDDWGAQLTLTLTADETGALHPSGSYNRNISAARDPLAPGGSVAQSLSLPFTTELSSQASRTDTYYSFYTVPELVRNRALPTVCAEFNPATQRVDLPLDRTGSSYLLSGQLGIRDWMYKALKLAEIPSSETPSSEKLKVLQYHIKFVVMTSATANPLWKLAPVTTGVGGQPLISTNRTRTHDLLLTIGPADIEKGKSRPVGAAVSLHTTGQLEQAISSGFRQAIGR